MKIISLNEYTGNLAEIFELNLKVWPRFIIENSDERTEEYMGKLAAFQVVAIRDERLVGTGNTIPLAWSEEDAMPNGWTGVIEQGIQEFEEKIPSTALCALSIAIHPDHLGQGISTKMIEAMKDMGRSHGLTHLLAPVRPTFKHKYPLIPMEDYITWRRDDGACFDPWMRVHERLGGEMVEVAKAAMVFEGSVSDWEEWTGQPMKTSGQYIVKGALHPLTIDVEADTGKYIEDNVWFKYTL